VLEVGVALLLGLILGSFLNVVIHRLPIMLDRQWRAECAELAAEAPAAPPGRYDLVVPRSACPKCGAPIKAVHNVPVLSWLALRGRCAACAAPISGRYPLVELATGILSAAVVWKYGAGWAALCALVVTWFLVALTMIDFDTQLLPDSMTLPLLWLGLAASLFHARIGGAGALPVSPPDAILGALAGYLSLWGVYHLFRLATGKEGMGYGDFKLFAALGAWLGWKMLLPIILLAAGVGAVLGIAMIAFRGRDRAMPIAFGPFLAAAGWLALMWGPELVEAYLGLYGSRG
jgi:leader peptidase (prepilin peptidase)/N-methyltransferase